VIQNFTSTVIIGKPQPAEECSYLNYPKSFPEHSYLPKYYPSTSSHTLLRIRTAAPLLLNSFLPQQPFASRNHNIPISSMLALHISPTLPPCAAAQIENLLPATKEIYCVLADIVGRVSSGQIDAYSDRFRKRNRTLHVFGRGRRGQRGTHGWERRQGRLDRPWV
jgi:hypothetical protein